jgi:hypothetical protein
MSEPVLSMMVLRGSFIFRYSAPRRYFLYYVIIRCDVQDEFITWQR